MSGSRHLALLSCGSDQLAAEFGLAAERCRFATSVRRIDPNDAAPSISPIDSSIVIVWAGDAVAGTAERWVTAIARAHACFGVFSAMASTAARPLADACADFLLWPTSVEETAIRLERFAGSPAIVDDDGELADHFTSFNLVGRSSAFVQVLQRIRRFAPTPATVLIEGPTGSGKELVARAIHYLGPRKGLPFVPVNCGALPDTLIESELFGHEPGAFTDARQARRGVVEQAQGGTLFLDEIDALTPKGQVALLRFLQDQEFRPLGSQRTRKADVRVLAASNASLAKLVRQGAFREDLLYRLNVLTVSVPPLSERREDIELLCRRILLRLRDRYGGAVKTLAPGTLAWLRERPWPGNVRELENVLHSAFVMSESNVLHLGPDADSSRSTAAFERDFRAAKSRIIESFEREYLTWLLAQTGGNVTQAARLAGKERRALGKLIRKHGLGPSHHPVAAVRGLPRHGSRVPRLR